MKYDVIVIGAGPGGIFSVYEMLERNPELKIAVFEAGHALNKRICPIDGEKVKSCIDCKSCSIMSGFGGAGAFSDGKYNITNDFGGTLHEYIGKGRALELMKYVDDINMRFGGEGTKLYTTAGSKFKKLCMQNDLHLLDASVRHLGTDINYIVLENLYAYMKDKADFYFDTPVESVGIIDGGYEINCKNASYTCEKCIISVGRSGSKWMEKVCRELDIPTKSNRVDIGVRVELPAEIFSHLTDELYESKIVYRTEKYGDRVRTFCMNPKGAVVNENTNGIITVNGHSYENPEKQTGNTNFALLVAKHFSEPFKDSNGYGESIARLSNMLGGGVIVQRFGDLISGHRSTPTRIEEAFITPTELEAVNKVAAWYTERLGDKFVTPYVPEGFYSSWAQYTLLLDSTEQRNELQAKLKAKGIPSMVYYPRGLHQQEAYKDMKLSDEDYPNTMEATKRVLSLPMHPYLDEETVDFIAKTILE